MTQIDLFAAPACDHLPVGQRVFIDGALICPRCGKTLRTKDGIDTSREN